MNQKKAGIVLSYVGTALQMIIQLVYTPVMIRLLGQSEYGLYTLVGSVVSYLSLFSFGFSASYLRFYSRYEEKKDRISIARLNGMYLGLFLVMGVAALICGMILSQFTAQLFGTKLTEAELIRAKMLMQVLVINIALTFPTTVFDSIVSAHEKFVFQRAVNLVGVVFNPLICLPLLLLGYGSVAVVSVTTLITLVRLFVNIYYCQKILNTAFQFRDIDKNLLKEISGFSFFLFLNMIIDQINWSVDKFILGRVSGTMAVAVYGVGSVINSMYTSFSMAISSVFAPQVNRIAATGLNKRAKQEYTRLMIKVGRVQFMILALIASGLLIFGRYFIVNIYATHEYEQAYYVALLLIFPATIPQIQNLGIEIQRAVNKHQMRSVIYMVMAILNIGISIPLSKTYGPVGAALGTAVSLLSANGLIMNIYYQKAIGIDILAFWRNIFEMTKALAPCFVIGWIIVHFVEFPNLFSFCLWILIYVIVYVVSFWLFGINQEEKAMVQRMLEKMRR